MKKSVYSVILSDDVVEAVDNLAYSMNTSRSNLINQILAEHLSFETPEKRMKSLFDSLERIFSENDGFKLLSQASDAMMSLKSPLRYKYNPSVKYSVSLIKSELPQGEIKVYVRTQNDEICRLMYEFYRVWIYLEHKYIYELLEYEPQYAIDGSRLIRKFYLTDLSEEAAASAISNYITVFDRTLKAYAAEFGAAGNEAAENTYVSYIRQIKNLL